MTDRARLVDVTLAVAVTAVISVAAFADISPQRPPTAGTFAFAVALGALMLVRRRWPVAVLLVSSAAMMGYYTLDFPPVGLALPLGAALYTAAEFGRLWWAVGVAAALIVISTVARALTGEQTAFLVAYDLPITVAVMGAAIAFGDGVRSRRRFREAVLAAAAADREHLIEQERLRVARDVHDVLAHTMSVVTLHADVAAEAVDDADATTVRRALGHIRDASTSAAVELRRTVALVRSPAGGLDGLSGLAQVSAAAGLPVRIRFTGTRRDLDAGADEAAYRVVQEAVTNARRHARPDRVDVLIEYGERQVSIVVTDDGPASGAPAGSGHGLSGMRERVALLGGTVTAGPCEPGWTVRAVIPA